MGNVSYDMTVVFSGTPVYSLNKTDRRNIAEILMKVELSTITLTPSPLQGRIRDFKLGGGGALKKIAPSGGRRENFGVFRVKNHIFSNFRGRPPGPAPALYKFVLRL